MVIERMVELHKNKIWKKNIMLATVTSKRDKKLLGHIEHSITTHVGNSKVKTEQIIVNTQVHVKDIYLVCSFLLIE